MRRKKKKLPRIHAINIRNSPDIGEMIIESKEQSTTQTELTANDEEVPDVESVDNYEEENVEALANLINCVEESVNEEVRAVGEINAAFA